MTSIKHQEFTAEMFTDEDGQLVTIRQEDYSGNGDNYIVSLHPWQLREVCERFGLLTSDPKAAKTITTLTRRLRVLADRIEYLAHYLANHSDHKHVDLSFEQTYATATADIATEFVAELDDDAQGATETPKQPTEQPKQKTGADTRQLSIEV